MPDRFEYVARNALMAVWPRIAHELRRLGWDEPLRDRPLITISHRRRFRNDPSSLLLSALRSMSGSLDPTQINFDVRLPKGFARWEMERPDRIRRASFPLVVPNRNTM